MVSPEAASAKGERHWLGRSMIQTIRPQNATEIPTLNDVLDAYGERTVIWRGKTRRPQIHISPMLGTVFPRLATAAN